MRAFVVSLAAGMTPLAMYGFSNGPPVRRTGAQVDGGINCTACHTTFAPANSDTRGRFTLGADPYRPGVKQTIRVSLEHPEAARWGFQLTARLASDESKMAGTFSPAEEIRVRCDPTGDAPCNGGVEFASHLRAGTVDSTRPGTSGSRSWEIEWTPPETDVGPVIFYAAGNAANNNNASSGDRIYTTRLRLNAACALTGRPAINANGIVNAASFSNTIGPNTLISIFGTGLAGAGTARAAAAFDFEDGRFPRELACVAVEIGGQRAPITFVSPNQINAQAPSLSVTGPVQVAVVLNPGLPGAIRAEVSGVTLQQVAPALFTFNGRALAALHTNFDIVGDPATLRFDRPVRPARPGDTVLLFGTGFGATNPAAQAGDMAAGQAPLTGQAAVTIGSLTLAASDVLYAGLAPNLISGVYQFNVRIPATTADGDVPVVIRMGSVQTQDRATILVRR
jgi:uncharacterized protein (TIGR03437 family)